ncbi:lytic transglycosylase domain-containing protein [Roseococcus sp. SYP-B2431]|uniref:lytic transglycosylase domain-containing protein n=1 Tax=Roseococcus sp. SYP-B2431 TaxID=2496640 RepID=UPI00104035D5|nr:lytic transglycosylase domain-containing protein [Roseococcus sp. SYP-B2431]TCH98777.1 lytic transglycosylase domain-containing protein [Roseococcus sp. SYP-B2431]
MQVFVARRASRLARPLAALGVLAMLAACGSTPQGGPSTSSRGFHQARSYDPPGPPSDPWGPWIREAARRFDVPDAWIRSVMRQESGGRARATSPVGAMGLMQVMPGTYRELQRRHDLGDDPYHPYDNLMAGTAYLREMYNLYGSPAFLAAYNAGPRRLEDYLYSSRGLPAETRNYVARVGPSVIRSSPVRRAPAEVYASAEIPLNVPAGPRRMDASMRAALADARSIREQNAQYASLPPAEARIAPVRTASAAPAYSSGSSSLAATGGGLVPMSGSGVVAMMPIPDGSTPEGAARLAESNTRAAGTAAPMGGEIMGDRIIVARMDPIPDGSTPEGAARMAELAARNEPPPPPPRAAPQLVASRPPVAAQPGGTRFNFISSAQASTLSSAAVRPAVANSGAWGVQVGAFTSPEQARQAAQGAQGSIGGRVAVMPVSVGRATLFRARVTGLSQGGAQQACDRLRGRNGCNVISPD